MSAIKQWKNQKATDFTFSNPGVLRKPWKEKKQETPAETAEKSEKPVGESVHNEDVQPGKQKYSWERPWPVSQEE